MIEVHGLSKAFGEVNALSDVSFKVNKGHVVGFLGANGAGKTTTMDIICGCLGVDQGTAEICGIDIAKDPVSAKKKLGYLPDTPPLYNDMIVEDIIKYSAKINGVENERVSARTNEVVELLNLGEVRNRIVGNLSKGYRQRVALANALVHEPEVLILDEPTEGLDPKQIAQMREVILKLKENHTILLSSHILHEVEHLCDSLVIINSGRIVAQDTYNNLAKKFSSNAYEMRVQAETEVALSELETLGVSNLACDDNENITFELSESMKAEDVAEMIISKGLGFVSLGPVRSNLENIFNELTS